MARAEAASYIFEVFGELKCLLCVPGASWIWACLGSAGSASAVSHPVGPVMASAAELSLSLSLTHEWIGR